MCNLCNGAAVPIQILPLVIVIELIDVIVSPAVPIPIAVPTDGNIVLTLRLLDMI